MTTGTEQFRRARDFLLEHREDYATAHRDFDWPRPERFNWALDWFDVIADDNDRTALHLVEEDGRETRMSFAELARRSDRVAAWLRRHGVAAEDRVLVMLGNPETAKVLFEYAREALAPYKRIRRLEFGELPKTVSGKIRRIELREATAAGSAAEYREEDFR